MRDDSTGGWVPVGGGGLSNVSVQKQRIYHDDEDQLCKHEYLIDGKRISDQAVSVWSVLFINYNIVRLVLDKSTRNSKTRWILPSNLQSW